MYGDISLVDTALITHSAAQDQQKLCSLARNMISLLQNRRAYFPKSSLEAPVRHMSNSLSKIIQQASIRIHRIIVVVVVVVRPAL